MVDTVRTMSYLTGTTFRDGQTSKSVGMQAIRDLVVSVPSLGGGGGIKSYLPDAYGAITDGGTFGDGLGHAASANGFATLAALQAAYPGASFTASGSGTTLTVTSVTGYIGRGHALGVRAGISAGITIVEQTSGTPGGAGTYTTSAATTGSSVATTSSYATKLTDDMAGLMIQKAIYTAHYAGDGNVILKAGNYFNIACGILFPAATSIKLIPFKGANLICSPCGTNPGITLQLQQGGVFPVSGLALSGLANFVSASGNTAGSPATNMYNAGSIAIKFIACQGSVIEGMIFNNFDRVHEWDTPIGTNYCMGFRDCIYSCNNKAANIDRPNAANSFERMWFENCTFGSNNYNAYINMLNGSTAVAGDVYFRNCSFDYPTTLHISNTGGANAFDNLPAIYCTSCHFETNVATTGSAERIVNDGAMVFIACDIFENGSNPNWFIAASHAAASQVFIACKTPGYSADNIGVDMVPLAGGGNNQNTQGYGNFSRVSPFSGLIGGQYASGLTSSRSLQDPAGYSMQGANSYLGYSYPTDKDILVTATSTIHVALRLNYPLGTVFSFISAPGATVTFAGDSGVTITTSGSGLTFGGSTAKTAKLVKTTANTWLACGQMN